MLKTSVKQLEMVSACPRKYAYHYLLGHPQFEGPALVDGNAVHAQMQALITGEVPPYRPESNPGKMARALHQAYVHNRSGEHISEIVKHVDLPEYGMSVQLRADYLDRPCFYDWKTTGAAGPSSKLPNGKLWAKHDLTDDFQANVYAHLIMSSLWDVDSVIARWCFVSKKFKEGQEPRVWMVEHEFVWEETRDWFEKYCLPARDLILDLRAAHIARGNDVPHNSKSCEHTGKFCAVAGHCRMLSSPVCSFEDLGLPEKES